MVNPKPLKYVDPETVEPDYEGVAQPVTIYDLPDNGGGDVEVSWGDVSDKPTAFPPETHTHNASDITAGELDADRIPGLPAAKIATGSLATARLANAAQVQVVNRDGDDTLSQSIEAWIKTLDDRLLALEG